jgi:protocatechuate 3,4-dioxygenase beta subunit
MSGIHFALLLLTLLPNLQQHPATQTQGKSEKQGTAIVSGRVILNGESLGGVTIRLVPERLSAPMDPSKLPQTIADGQGKYRIDGIPAGSYHVDIVPNEYLITGGLPSELQRKMVTVTEGEKVEQFDLVLKRGGVITGRVTDSNGNPLTRQIIELTRIGDDGQPQPVPFNHPVVKLTDQQGVYRIPLVPEGRYLVSAGIKRTGNPGTSPPGAGYYPQTFHPNATDQSQARVVAVSEGAEIAGVDILIEKALKTYDLSGRVVRAETSDPVEGIDVYYSPLKEGGGVAGPRSQRARSNSDGEFQFQGLLPGKYAVYPQIGGEREYFCEPVICEITDGGLDGVAVKLQQGGSISGTIVIDGTNDPAVMAKLSQLFIGAFSKQNRSVVLPRDPAKINADGRFRIAGLPPGKLYFSLSRDPRAGGFSIIRVERGGALAPDGLELGPGENLANVRVIVGYGSLSLHGEVKVIGGSLPQHIGLYVNLNRVNESESGSTIGAFADARGQFAFHNLLPGDYEVRLVATNFQPGEPRDKGLGKLILNTKQNVTLGRASQATVTLVIDLSKKESN